MPVKTGFYIRVIDNEVVEVWDTPGPAGQNGWSDAVEVTPDLVENREVIGSYTIDITKTPMEIVWSKVELSVEDRKNQLIGEASFPVFVLQRQLETAQLNAETDKIAELTTQIEAANVVKDERVSVINAAVTHEDVDALL